jgi:hypothetical protein
LYKYYFKCINEKYSADMDMSFGGRDGVRAGGNAEASRGGAEVRAGVRSNAEASRGRIGIRAGARSNAEVSRDRDEV